MTSEVEVRKLTLRQREGRAINAIAELLRHALSVPNIYLEPPPSLIVADILAVDRGGAGDLHAVEIKLARDLNPLDGQSRKPVDYRQLNARQSAWYPKFSQQLRSIHRQLMAMPAHYRYLAIPVESFSLVFSELAHFGLFPEDGIGRLGIITIAEKGEDAPLAAMSAVPERFRVEPAKLRTIETKLLTKSRPDIEVRI